MKLDLWLLDDAERPPEHSKLLTNLLNLWINPALEDLDDFGQLRPETRAAIFGARVRTDPSLLASADWAYVLRMIPHPDDKPPHTREADAERLVELQLHELAWCEREFDEWLVRTDEVMLESPASEEDVDFCVNLMARVDAMSRTAIAIAWLIDAHGSVSAPAARQYLDKFHRFMHGFSGSADRLLLAEELAWAIGQSFSPDVLSTGVAASEQIVAVASLPQPAREARESAVWFCEVYGTFEGCAIEAGAEN